MSIPFTANALNWKVYGACSNQPVAQGQYSADLSKNVGETSISIFNSQQIPFIGAPEGFNSILNTAIGIDALEIVSDTEMRAYGWCYSVNGKDLTKMPDQAYFTKQSDELIWYYAYSTNKNGQWSDYCSPAYWIKAIQFCGR